MHTVTVIVEGLVLLGLCLVFARLATQRNSAGRPRALYSACKIFIGVWLVCAFLNLWKGVTEAGYSVMDELPILALVFGVPAAAAALIGYRVMATLEVDVGRR